MEVPLQWKLSVDGNNQVKSVMADLKSAFDRGQISGSDYADSLSKVAREGNKVNNVSRYQNQIFLSMHPNINKLSRGFSLFASIARTTLTLMTSINTLLIAQNTQSSTLSEITRDMAENRREFNRTLDPEKLQQLNEEYAVLIAREKEVRNQDNITFWQGWANVVLGAGLIANTFKGHIGSISKIFTSMVGLKIGGIFSAIAIGMAFAVEELYKFLFGIEDMDKWRAENQKTLIEFFTISIPNALGVAASFLTNFFLNDLPLWASKGWQTVSDVFVETWNNLMGFIEDGINGALKGFSDFVNMIINGINAIISGINRAFKSNIPKIAPFVIKNISLPRIDTEKNTGVNNSVGVGTGITNNITIMGSILSEKEFDSHIDQYIKNSLTNRGFK